MLTTSALYLLLTLTLPTDYFECENYCSAKRRRCELRCEDVGSVQHAQCYQRCRENHLTCRQEECR